MRIVLSLLLLLSFSIAANAQTPRISRIDIIEVGIYQADEVSETAAPNTTKGTVASLDNIKLIKSTTTIPARIGIRFGFRYKIIGQPTGSQVVLKIVSRFPPPGIRNTSTNQMQMSEESSSARAIGDVHYRGILFDDPGDLIPGRWVIEIWYGNRKLAQQQFTLVKP